MFRTLAIFVALQGISSAGTVFPETGYRAFRPTTSYEQFDGVWLSWSAGETNDYPSSRHFWQGDLSFSDAVDISPSSMNLQPGDLVDDQLFSDSYTEPIDLSVQLYRSYQWVEMELAFLGAEPTMVHIVDEVSVRWSSPFEGLDGTRVSKQEGSSIDTRHVGFRHTKDGEAYFGWFEVLATDHGFRLGTLYVNDLPGEPAVVANVPEPLMAPIAFATLLCGFAMRRSRIEYG